MKSSRGRILVPLRPVLTRAVVSIVLIAMAHGIQALAKHGSQFIRP
jgi:hypothetical protein